MTKPHPPPRDPSARGGGNPSGEELKKKMGQGVVRTTPRLRACHCNEVCG